METLCACGCGVPTKVAVRTDPRHGHVKGQPVRYLKGHHRRGLVNPPEVRAKISAANTGERNYNWRGDQAGYRAMHSYLNKMFPKVGRCELCGQDTKTQYARTHDRPISRNREDYRELCSPCHVRYDLKGVPLTAAHRANLGESLKLAWARRKAS